MGLSAGVGFAEASRHACLCVAQRSVLVSGKDGSGIMCAELRHRCRLAKVGLSIGQWRCEVEFSFDTSL
jgi:hypothetical protein